VAAKRSKWFTQGRASKHGVEVPEVRIDDRGEDAAKFIQRCYFRWSTRKVPPARLYAPLPPRPADAPCTLEDGAHRRAARFELAYPAALLGCRVQPSTSA